MVNEFSGPVIFLMALLARSLFFPLVILWFSIGYCALVGAPISWAADYAKLVVLLSVVTVAAVFSVVRRNPAVVENLNRGRSGIGRLTWLVIGGAALAQIFGLFLTRVKEPEAGHWSLLLGVTIALFEVASIAAESFLRPDTQ